MQQKQVIQTISKQRNSSSSTTDTTDNNMDDSVHEEEKARLVCAHDLVSEMFEKAEEHSHMGVTREHILMAVLLHCRESDRSLMENILHTHEELSVYFQSAKEFVENFEANLAVPPPPAPLTTKEEEEEEEDDFTAKAKRRLFLSNPTVAFNPQKCHAHTRTGGQCQTLRVEGTYFCHREHHQHQKKEKEIQPSSPSTENKITGSGGDTPQTPGKKTPKRGSLRSFFSGSIFKRTKSSEKSERKKSLTRVGRSGSLRNNEWTTEAIAQNFDQNTPGYTVSVPIRMLDGQLERMSCTSETNSQMMLDAFLKTIGISNIRANQTLAIFENNKSRFRRILPTELILYVVSGWAGLQEHVDDEDYKLVVRRTQYTPGDTLETLSSTATSSADGALRLTYSDCVYHLTRGLYRLDPNNIPKAAASILYCNNDGIFAKKLSVGLTKQVKQERWNIFPPHLQEPTSKELTNLTKGVKSYYNMLQGNASVPVVMQEFVKMIQANASEEYGSRFFPIQYKQGNLMHSSTTAAMPTQAVLGVNYPGLSLAHFSDTGVCLSVLRVKIADMKSTSITKDMSGNDVLCVQRRDSGDTLIMMHGLTDLLEIQRIIEHLITKPSSNLNRKVSVADTTRRQSVTLNSASILADMADAFGDFDFADEEEETTAADPFSDWQYEGGGQPQQFQAQPQPGVEPEENEEAWSPHKDPSGKGTYFYNNTTGESSWENPNEEFDVAEDPDSGKSFFVHKQTRRTSWLVSTSDSFGQTPARTTRGLSTVGDVDEYD